VSSPLPFELRIMFTHCEENQHNPRVYIQPSFHEKDLNNLDVQSNKRLTREDIGRYFDMLKRKITDYNDELTNNILLQKPEKCEWTRFTLILAQHRHLHSHMGMLMGFIIKGNLEKQRLIVPFL